MKVMWLIVVNWASVCQLWSRFEFEHLSISWSTLIKTSSITKAISYPAIRKYQSIKYVHELTKTLPTTHSWLVRKCLVDLSGGSLQLIHPSMKSKLWCVKRESISSVSINHCVFQPTSMEDFSDWKCGHDVSSSYQRCIDSELLEFDEQSVRFSSCQFEVGRLILNVNVERNSKPSVKSKIDVL